jgi:hypothetical protein
MVIKLQISYFEFFNQNSILKTILLGLILCIIITPVV